MARAPFNVLVLPFWRSMNDEYLFCAMRRADTGYWQWISGGGEDDEKPEEAARREAHEESGLNGQFFRLSCVSSVPVTALAGREHWPPDLYVVPEYTFAVEAPNRDVTLSPEHTEYWWLPFEECQARLHWQSNKDALWELNARLADRRMLPLG